MANFSKSSKSENPVERDVVWEAAERLDHTSTLSGMEKYNRWQSPGYRALRPDFPSPGTLEIGASRSLLSFECVA